MNYLIDILGVGVGKRIAIKNKVSTLKTKAININYYIEAVISLQYRNEKLYGIIGMYIQVQRLHSTE